MSPFDQLPRRSFLRQSLLLGWFPFFHRKRFETLGGLEFEISRSGRSDRRYIVIHGDEPTAKDVLHLHMQAYEGLGFTVVSSTREVELGGLKLDPNRMFTSYGAEATLRKLNPSASSEQIKSVLDELDRERPRLLREIAPRDGGRMVALHNNREYSVEDEIASSDEVSIQQPGLPRHFFLCTNPNDYAVMKQSPFNVVLQTKGDPDDGSLSRLAARQGFRYINLECAVGDLELQLERLRWLEEHLP